MRLKRYKRRWTGGLTLVASGATLAACAQPPPAVVTSQYTPARAPAWASPTPSQRRAAGQAKADAGKGPAGATCRLHLAGVQDMRADPQSMGSIAGRPIHAQDSVGWVESGLQTLARDPALRIAGPGEAADVELKVDLLKAYILSLTQVKAATVVVRVHYGPAAIGGDQTYRGAVDGINWASGEGESRAALNSALSKVVDAVHADVLSRCRAAHSS